MSQSRSLVPSAKALVLAGSIAGATMAGASAGYVGAGAYLARLLLSPVRNKPDNVLVTGLDEERGLITLAAGADTSVPGRYGLWLDRGAGHLRLGDIIEHDTGTGRVVRPVEAVDFGAPAIGPARWDSYYYATDPDVAFGLPCEHIVIDSEVGELPAWHIPARDPAAAAARRCAVLVHGRAASRHECLRAVPVLHAIGLDILIPTYRNDPDAPASPDGLYNLGLSEWRDVERAVQHVLSCGAEDVVLFGWSMGAAVVLQMLDLSPLSAAVSQVVLDSPVIDWVDVIAQQARARRVPAPLAMLAQGMIGNRWSSQLVGVHEPIDVARTSWQLRSDELRHPILLIHSADDDFVPAGPSRQLAGNRPDLVRYEEWTQARHVSEWNVDPLRWDRVVREFLAPAS